MTPSGLLASGVKASRRQVLRLSRSRPAAVNCPACGTRIREAAHAVVVHGDPYHVDCALYSRPR